jgi:hypothetical protein
MKDMNAFGFFPLNASANSLAGELAFDLSDESLAPCRNRPV